MSKTKIVDQPINSRIDDLYQTFESEYRFNPFEKENLNKIFGDATATESYTKLLLAEVSDESEKERISDTIANSMKEYRYGAAAALFRSEEGFDHTSAPGSNLGALDAYVPATIVGYNAKSIMLDVYKAINHKDREFPYQFEIAYAIDSSSTSINDRKILPNSILDGTIGGMLNPNYVDLTPGSTVPGQTSIIVANNKAYAKLGGKGNAITESGKDIRDWALAEDIRVVEILYDDRIDTTEPPTVLQLKTMTVSARAEVKGYGGDVVSARHIGLDVNLKLADNSFVNDFFSVYVDRDTGAYRVTACSTNRIKGLLFSIPFLNPTNAASSIRHGREVITGRVIARPRKTLGVGLAMDTVMDEFVSANSGTSDIVKYVSNEFSNILAGINDNDMENHMIANIDSAAANKELLKNYTAYRKLGGYVAAEDINLTLRGPGGERPLSWIEEGIKDVVSQLLILAETDTYFSHESEREWVFTGYQTDIRRFVDTKYTTDTNLSNEVRFGFKKIASYAYSDNFGQRVKFIGSAAKRWKDRSVYAFLRSNTPKVQPTGVYHGYDFRIVKSRDPRQAGIDTISFWVHDVWDILTLVGLKLTLDNPTNLYESIVTSMPGYTP
jgi:hypothetical protein